MKRFFQISGMALLIMLFADLRNPVSAQPGGDVSYQDFYDELSPYGRWIDYPEYGYVWAPNEGADFRPYSTNGQWVWSDDYEWMWVSDYSWGWAPFHYGRWFYDDLYGWMWEPGYDWSPAWVAWRSGGDYYGWAPLQPGITIGVGFSMGGYAPPVNYWCFAPSRYITSPRIYNYCVNPRQNVTIIHNTTIINNYNYRRNVFVTGPRRNDVERFTHQRISPVRVREISSPRRGGFRNNEVAVYRPGIRRDDNRGFAPRRFDNYSGRRDNSIARRNDNRNNGTRLDNRAFERNNDEVNRRSADNNERATRNANNDRAIERRNNEVIERRNNENLQRRNNEILERRNNENIQRRNNEAVERRNNENLQRRNNENLERRNNENIERRNNENIQRRNNEAVERRNNENIQRRNNENLQRRNNENMQRRNNENIERRNNPVSRPDNNVRERSARDFGGNGGRRGFDRPAQQNQPARQGRRGG